MKRPTLSLIAVATALAADTGFAALTAPDGSSSAGAKAPARLPVERSSLLCPAPSTSEVAETVYTSYTPAGKAAAPCGTEPPPAVVMKRLRADPALRLNENGRDLLRLLDIHTVRLEDWNRIIESVPPHRLETVAQLARSCADKWSEIASRIESNASHLAG